MLLSGQQRRLEATHWCPGSRPSLIEQMVLSFVQPGACKGHSSCVWRTSNRLVYPDSQRRCDCRPGHRNQCGGISHGGSLGTHHSRVERARETIFPWVDCVLYPVFGPLRTMLCMTLESGLYPVQASLGSCHRSCGSATSMARKRERLSVWQDSCLARTAQTQCTLL